MTPPVQPVEPARQPFRLRAWRIAKIILVVCAILLLGELVGIDIVGWCKEVWDRITKVDPIYIVAACGVKTVQTGLVALGLRNIIRASYPDGGVTYRLAFGTYAVSVAGNAVLPAKGGSLLMLGLWRITIPKSAIPTLIAILAVNTIAFSVFAALNWVFLLFSAPEILGQAKKDSNLLTWIAGHPWLTIAIVVGVTVLAVEIVRRFKPKVRAMMGQLADGAAILRTPWRYVYAVVAPQALSYVCRWAYTGILMAAFGIPVTVRTILLVIAAGSLAGLVQFTPGGIGTRQALDCVALEGYADCSAVTAYSLSQQAVSTAWNLVLGGVGLLWAFGWSDSVDMIRRRREIIASVRSDGDPSDEHATPP